MERWMWPLQCHPHHSGYLRFFLNIWVRDKMLSFNSQYPWSLSLAPTSEKQKSQETANLFVVKRKACCHIVATSYLLGLTYPDWS